MVPPPTLQKERSRTPEGLPPGMSRTATTESAHGRSRTPDGLPPGMSRTPTTESAHGRSRTPDGLPPGMSRTPTTESAHGRSRTPEGLPPGMSRTPTTESAHGRSRTLDGLPPGMSPKPEAAPVAWEDYEDAHLFLEPAELTLNNFDYMAVLCELRNEENINMGMGPVYLLKPETKSVVFLPETKLPETE